jgi:hypothetical protein
MALVCGSWLSIQPEGREAAPMGGFLLLDHGRNGREGLIKN